MYVAWSLVPDVGDAFSHVRLTVSGAAPLPAEALTRFLDATGHHVFEGYGLTETAPVLTSTLMSAVAKPTSIGRPIPGVELRLADDSGGVSAEDDPGEITVRGANLFAGYWPDGAGGPDAAGWFRTGDVAYADDDGDLHIVDRRRELILVSGFNVYPREVEDVLASHPGIEEAAVIGIAHPYTGESVKAVIVCRPGVQLTSDEVIAHCTLALAPFKCPTSVEFVAELPRSATGKAAKGRLREAAAVPAGPPTTATIEP
jgi:long-chain acyl-CoA synthetase